MYLKRLRRDIWRSVEEGPHVLILPPVQPDGTQARLGGGQAIMNQPKKDDLDKMENDVVAFYEISCGDAPENLDFIINCKSTIEIWDVLKNSLSRVRISTRQETHHDTQQV